MTDPSKFTSLFVKYERQLYSIIASMLGHPAEAEDLLQETAKVLWKKFGDYDPKLPFLPWAKTFARYEVLNYVQKQKTRRKYFSTEMMELLGEDFEFVDAHHDARILALESCVAALPENSRTLLDERYRDANSLQEVAVSQGTTPNALYKTLQRVRKGLLDCVNQKVAEGMA
jgi:RNA polymerase sigma-70 factor (ECF subfamily)